MKLLRGRTTAMARAPSGVPSTDLVYVHDPSRLRDGNRVQALVDGGQAYPAMLAAIESASRQVLMESYILRADDTGQRFGEALARRARAGVPVRLIYDAAGSIGISMAFVQALLQAGVQVIEYRPIAPWRPRWGIARRNHRKTLVVDGRVGFVGGLNIGDEYAPAGQGGGGWHDMHLRVEGPVVDDLARGFRRAWIRAGGADFALEQAGADGPPATPDGGTALAMAVDNTRRRRRTGIRRAYLHAMKQARTSIRLMNSYFVPDLTIRWALRNAAHRGVDVRIILPSTMDVPAIKYATQYLYARLLRAGVRIFEWPGEMMHAKTAVIDGVWTTVGSFNLDYQSLFYNMEVIVAVVDRPFAARLEAQFDEDVAKSREIRLEEWKKRSLWQRVLEWFFFQFHRWL